ncbi:MAG: hypothetical protein QG620_327 [Patescibacteria group bacterium]|nr:hypothetical protein [Patescibacteria group bacterium]
MRNKIKKRTINLEKLFKLHLALTGFFMAAYLLSGYFLGWGALLSDINQKGRVAGVTVSAVVKVFGPPDPPVLAASAGCDGQNQPYVYLSWNEEDDATSYDIHRGGAELMSGLLDNYYTDESAGNGVNYSYTVTAVGPMGNAVSDPVSVASMNCSQNAIPEISITTFRGKNVASYHGIPSTTDRTPSFSGSTSIANAVINIEIHSGPIIYAETGANSNGFWQWTPGVNLSRVTHTIYVTAVDPQDPSVTASTSLVFKIKEEEEESEDDEEEDEETSETSSVVESVPLVPIQEREDKDLEVETEIEKESAEKPFDFDVELQGETYIRGVEISEEAYRGENLDAKILFNKEAEKYGQAEIIYVISGSDGLSEEFRDRIDFAGGLSWGKKIPLSYKLKTGKYKLQVNVTVGETTVSHEGYFILKDRSVIKIGAGTLITMTDIMSNLGWLVFLAILILLILLMLTAWEHHLTKQALFHITERFLKRKRYIN